MKPLPTDPIALRARVFSALCDDILDLGGGKTRGFDRMNAIRETMVQREKGK